MPRPPQPTPPRQYKCTTVGSDGVLVRPLTPPCTDPVGPTDLVNPTNPVNPTDPGNPTDPASETDQDDQTGIDLNELLIRNPEMHVLLRVCGPSMEGAGIRDGALLVVERGAPATPGQIVVAHLNDGFTVKRLARHGDRLRLEAAHPSYPPLSLEEGDQVWGVVRHVIQAP